jgi:ABC-type Fe3+-hydroxamate transport system substrate-binding protein
VRQQRDLDMWRALPSLPAVRTNRLFMFGSEMMVIPGPRVAEATRILAKALHPEAFSQAAEVRRSPSS